MFSAEWLFYQPLWLFSPSRLPAQCERGLDAPLSSPLFPCSISPPFLSSALVSWRDCHPVCVYRWPALSSAPQQMNLLPSKSPEMATCLYRDTWLSKSFSLTPMHATGPSINGETWRIMHVDRGCGTQSELTRLCQPQTPFKAITACVADMKEDWLEVCMKNMSVNTYHTVYLVCICTLLNETVPCLFMYAHINPCTLIWIYVPVNTGDGNFNQ